MPKILIVDNEWLTRLEIEGMLTDLGYDVTGQAETGAEAVAMARELNPDLILMDVKMPGEMNGIDAAREIKAELEIPIVFISGYGDPEYIEAAKEIAPFGYVMKPFDEREVHAFVEIALSRRKLELKLEESHGQLEQTNLDLLSEIAARKRTEKALRESKKLYRDIFEKNNAVKWLLDPSSGEIIDANPAACEFYQYSYEEITKLRLWDINIESEDNIRQLLARAFSDGNTDFTFKHRLASGEIRDVRVYTGPLESGGKKFLHSIIIDITDRIRAEESLKHAHDTLEIRVENRTAELGKANKLLQEENEARKRTEDALRESEEHLRSFMESAEGFAVYRLRIDPEDYYSGHVIFVSPSLKDTIGVSPQDEFSKWFENIHDDDLPSVINAQKESAQTGVPFRQEFRLKTLEGGLRWVQAISNGVFDSEGKPKYYNGMIIDVTAQKQAEKALRESQQRMALAMEGGNIGMFDWNLRTGEVFFDRRLHKSLGYSPSDLEISHSSLEKVIHPEDWPKTQQALEDNIMGKTPFYEKEARLKCKSGQWRWMLTRAKIVESDSNGEALRMIGTSLDINDRKLMEIELQNKTLELSETNTALKVLLNHREKDKEELGDKVLSNVKTLVEPYLKELKDSRVDQKQIGFIRILRTLSD